MKGVNMKLPWKKKKKQGMTKEQIEIFRKASGCINSPNINLNKIRDFYKHGE
jgi:hypothetical protein